jgi:hypothetical protein
MSKPNLYIKIPHKIPCYNNECIYNKTTGIHAQIGNNNCSWTNKTETCLNLVKSPPDKNSLTTKQMEDIIEAQEEFIKSLDKYDLATCNKPTALLDLKVIQERLNNKLEEILKDE